MLNITALPLGVYQTNCYIFYEESSPKCCVVDPGGEPHQVEKFCQTRNLTVEAILLTHGHFDHVGAVKELAETYGCLVYIHKDDLTLPEKFTAGPLYYTNFYDEGDVLELAGLTIPVIHTPGHTEGSVCLIVDDAIISGDTLFARSCGRWDLPGGDGEKLKASLQRFKTMEGEYRIFPGHGKSTTLALEQEYNPYLKDKK